MWCTRYVRQIAVVGRLDEECLRGQTGAVGQELARDPAPGQLVALGVRDLVVAALLVDALPQAQQVDMAGADLGLALENGATLQSVCAHRRGAAVKH
jgi:hypothetical protein